MRTHTSFTRTTATLAISALLIACGKNAEVPSAPVPVDGVAYMNAMVDTMETFSVNRKKIDWVSFRSQVLAALPADAQINDASPAIVLALKLLGDNHSVYTSANHRDAERIFAELRCANNQRNASARRRHWLRTRDQF